MRVSGLSDPKSVARGTVGSQTVGSQTVGSQAGEWGFRSEIGGARNCRVPDCRVPDCRVPVRVSASTDPKLVDWEL